MPVAYSITYIMYAVGYMQFYIHVVASRPKCQPGLKLTRVILSWVKSV